MTPWFKLWTNHLPVFEAAPDDALGRAIRAALVYCQTDQLPELDPLSNMLFVLLKKDVDESASMFQEAVEKGKRGANVRWKKTIAEDSGAIAGDSRTIAEDSSAIAGDSRTMAEHSRTIAEHSSTIAGDAEAKEAKEAKDAREAKDAQEAPEGKDARKGAKKAPGRKAAPDWQSMMAEFPFSPAVREAILEWLRYKSERREPYRTQGLRSLLRQLDASCHQYGDDAVVQLIGQCMASGWKGLIFDRLSTASPAKPTGPRQPDEQERQAIARMMRQVD